MTRSVGGVPGFAPWHLVLPRGCSPSLSQRNKGAKMQREHRPPVHPSNGEMELCYKMGSFGGGGNGLRGGSGNFGLGGSAAPPLTLSSSESSSSAERRLAAGGVCL